MKNARTALAVAALAATAASPAAALAAGGKADPTPTLGGSPQMRILDSHHARLQFASSQLPRTKDGGFAAKITFAGGTRKVTKITLHGTHGLDDKVYYATVASTTPIVEHATYQVTFRLGKSAPAARPVKVYRMGEHG